MARGKKRTSKSLQKQSRPAIERVEPEVREVNPSHREEEAFSGEKFEIFIGPLPRPDMFREYHEIDPKFSHKIVEMAEKEQDHRHAQERKLADADVKGYFRGQNWAGFITLALIGAMVYLFSNDRTWQAAGMGAAGFSAVIVAFLKNRFVEKPKPPTAKSGDGNGPLPPAPKR